MEGNERRKSRWRTRIKNGRFRCSSPLPRIHRPATPPTHEGKSPRAMHSSPPAVPAQLPGRCPPRTKPRRPRIPAAPRRRTVGQGMSRPLVRPRLTSLVQGAVKISADAFYDSLENIVNELKTSVCLNPRGKASLTSLRRLHSQSRYRSKNPYPKGRRRTTMTVCTMLHLTLQQVLTDTFWCSHQAADGPLHHLAQCQSQEIQKQGRVCC